MIPILCVERKGVPIAGWMDGKGNELFRAPSDMTLVKIRTRPLTDDEIVGLMVDWCKANCRDHYAYPIYSAMRVMPQQQFYFSDKREAMLFKLRWGNGK